MITPKKYTLDDGTVWTAMTLGAELKMCHAAARYRLETSQTAEVVLRKKETSRHSVYNSKQYELSDGTKLSARQISERFNINHSTMNARLAKGITDVEKLAKKPGQGKRPEGINGYVPIESQAREVKNYYKDRMMYSKEFDWSLFMRAS
jgi:hypothetical protein